MEAEKGWRWEWNKGCGGGGIKMMSDVIQRITKGIVGGMKK